MKENQNLFFECTPLGHKEQSPWYHMHVSHNDPKCLVLLVVIILQHILHYHLSPASNPQTQSLGLTNS